MNNIKNDIPCMQLRNIVKKFGNVTAVDNVDLIIEEGEIFSLLGPSGCGKTTLLRIIAGLENPDEGEILLKGEVVNTIPPYKRECSLVFQNLALFPHMRVKENVDFGLAYKRISTDERDNRISEMLNLVELTGMEKRYPNQISGGQQQRVALARSLILHPEILLLDEPLASLDRKLRKEMQVVLKRIQREVRTTFLYVTHDQKVALSLSDRIAVMRDGKIEQIGTSNDIYEKPRTTFVADFMGAANVFLGKPVVEKQGKLRLESEDDLSITAHIENDVKIEDIVGFSVHPEMIKVLPKDVESKVANLTEHNKLYGRIKDKFYQGDFSEIIVDLNQTKKSVNIHLGRSIEQELRSSLNIGVEVLVYWPWRYGNLLVQ